MERDKCPWTVDKGHRLLVLLAKEAVTLAWLSTHSIPLYFWWLPTRSSPQDASTSHIIISWGSLGTSLSDLEYLPPLPLHGLGRELRRCTAPFVVFTIQEGKELMACVILHKHPGMGMLQTLQPLTPGRAPSQCAASVSTQSTCKGSAGGHIAS